jgi:hypothetical protein
MYYKFINEYEIKKAPKPLKIDGKDVFTNSEKIHNEQGYYRLLTSEYPQDDKYYEARYKQIGTLIVQEWVVGEVQI